MAETIERGPAISLGALTDANLVVINGVVQTNAQIQPTDGPSISYQGDAIPDVRVFPANKDGLQTARIPCFVSSPYIVMVDAIPSVSSASGSNTGTVAAAQAISSAGGAFTLISTQPSCSASGSAAHGIVPLIPKAYPTSYTGTVGTPINVLALDFGFTYGTTTASSTTVTVADSSLFYVGQWICIAGAGNSATTLPLVTQVTAIPTSTTITLATAAIGAVTRAPIGSTNYSGPYPAGSSANAVNPYWNGGVAGLFNPTEGIARNIAVYAAANAITNSVVINGYDVYGYKMTETISFTTSGSAQTVYGKKAFKYIYSATLTNADGSHNVSLGVGDVIGYALRIDKWEYSNNFYNGTFTTAQTGWTQAYQPTSGASTATSADVRGTIQVGSAGGGSPISGGANLDGTKRIALMMTVPLSNLINCTPAAPQYMFGTAQYSNF